MKILLIEDEIDIRETLSLLLELYGHTVTAVGDGLEGVEQARKLPDLIFCDVGLPGLDGYQVITEIRKMPECESIPFIFLTARADRNDQRRGMALGADDYLTKPCTEKEIMDAIESRVRRLQPMQEKLEKLDIERRSELGADWSHELLTPLNAVMGGLELLEQQVDEITPEELKEIVQIIRDGANRQHELSRKLVRHFELARIKAAPETKPTSNCDAAKIIPAAANRVAEENNRMSDMAVTCAAGSVSLPADYLDAAITEVLGNAFHFSQPRQPVTVTGVQHEDHYLIEILDQGTGMTPDQIDSIGSFKQFGRNEMEQQGLGLGLSIAQSIAEIAGGSFSLEQGPNGIGIKARFELPMA